MKPKTFRWLLLLVTLALAAGCRSNNPMDTGDFVALRESYDYQGPNTGFYDSWYGGGAYVGAGGYGGVGVGISIPVIP